MVTIRGYAERCGVSYEAIRQQIHRYSAELEGHIEKRNRTQFLDDFAVAFLDDKRRENVIGVVDVRAATELHRLREQVAELQGQLITAQQALIDAQAKHVELAEAATKYAGLLVEHAETEKKLAEARTQRDQDAAEAAEQIKALEAERDAAQAEVRSYSRTLFGFYWKK